MLTIFAIPKGFHGHIGTIQRNAIQSWTLLRPRPEIILMGNDDGTAATAKQLDLVHIPDIQCNEYGTPLVNDLFLKAQKHASNPVVCYINSDIIVTTTFLLAVIRLTSNKNFRSFLMVGRRWNLNITSLLDFSAGWEERLRADAEQHGVLEPPDAIDYFVFVKDTFSSLPEFAIGRPMWDNWLLYQSRLLGIPVIDATDVSFVVHQNHDYKHVAESIGRKWEGPEAEMNRRIGGGWAHCFDLRDATHRMTENGFVRVTADLHRTLKRFTILHPKYRLLNRTINYLLWRVENLK